MSRKPKNPVEPNPQGEPAAEPKTPETTEAAAPEEQPKEKVVINQLVLKKKVIDLLKREVYYHFQTTGDGLPPQTVVMTWTADQRIKVSQNDTGDDVLPGKLIEFIRTANL